MSRSCTSRWRRSGGGAVRAERIEECARTAGQALERVRLLSLGLRPPQLEDLGLAAALRAHLDRQGGLGQLTPHLEAGDAPREIDAGIEIACFRVAQEAITNVLRHAKARDLWLRLFTAGGRLALSVRDNGAGLGLVDIEERIALAGGTLELRSAPGQGTVVLATFPLQRGASVEGA